jgi:hypothetical protein
MPPSFDGSERSGRQVQIHEAVLHCEAGLICGCEGVAGPVATAGFASTTRRRWPGKSTPHDVNFCRADSLWLSSTKSSMWDQHLRNSASGKSEVGSSPNVVDIPRRPEKATMHCRASGPCPSEPDAFASDDGGRGRQIAEGPPCVRPVSVRKGNTDGPARFSQAEQPPPVARFQISSLPLTNAWYSCFKSP